MFECLHCRVVRQMVTRQIQMSNLDKWECGQAVMIKCNCELKWCSYLWSRNQYLQWQWSTERKTAIRPEIRGKQSKLSLLHSHLSIDQDSCQVSQYFHYTSLQMFWKVMISVWRPLPSSCENFHFPFITLTFSMQLWSQNGRSQPCSHAGINPEDESWEMTSWDSAWNWSERGGLEMQP